MGLHSALWSQHGSRQIAARVTVMQKSKESCWAQKQSVRFDSHIVQPNSHIIQFNSHIVHSFEIQCIIQSLLERGLQEHDGNKHYLYTRFEIITKSYGVIILRILFSFIPFYVCLFWFIAFITHYKKNDSQTDSDMVSRHLRSALPLPWPFFHRRPPSRHGVSLDVVLVISLSPLLRVHLQFGVPAHCPAQTLSRLAPRHHSGSGKIPLPRGSGR